MWSRAPLLGFDAYRQNEALLRDAAVGPSGALLEYETLALRVDPPNVTIDNDGFSDCTRLTIDSANRPGTLVEVVQCLTELSLSIVRARISSDGGWFINELHICEPPSGRVTDERKLAALRRMLSVGDDRRAAGGGGGGESRTVLQMVGPDNRGILADITTLLIHNGLDVRSAALWTFRGRAACVITATDPGGRGAVADGAKLARLREILADALASRPGDSALVEIEPEVHGPVHHERRLHQLMLADEHKAWQQLVNLQRHPSLPFPARIPTPDDPAAVPGASPRGAALFSPSTDALLRDQEPPELGERTRRLQDEVVALEAAAGALSLADERSAEAAAGARDQDRGGGRGAASPRPPGKAGGVVAALPQLPELRVRPCGDAPAGQGQAAATTGPASDAGSGAGAQSRGGGGGPGSAARGSSEPSTPRSQPATPRTPGALSRELSAGGTPLALPPGARLRVTTPPQARAGAAADGVQQQQQAGGAQAPPPRSPLPPLPPGGPYATAVAAAAAAAAGGAADGAALPHPPAPPVPGAFLGAPPPAAGGPAAGEDGAPPRAPHPAQPMVSVRFNNDRKYWQVEIRCRDRNKLCFDTVCTLADLRFDVYHAALDSEGGVGSQLFYCRPRFGPPFEFDQDRAATLQAMLVSAVQRRFPPGLKLLVYEPPTAAAAAAAAAATGGVGSAAAIGGDAAAAAAAAAAVTHPAIGRHGGQLAALAAALRDWGLSVTRCKVREPDAADGDSSGGSGSAAPGGGGGAAASAAQPLTHTFYLAAGDGRLPSRDVVRQACESAGGEEISWGSLDGAGPGGGAVGGAGAGGSGPLPLLARGRWAFAFAQRGGPAGVGGGGHPASAARQLPRRKSGGGGAAGAVAPAVWQAEAHASSFESGHTLSF